jgi:diguanylate cyclase (GGDEF)-like protein
MKRAIEHSRRPGSQFSILFIDGDNLRFYNEISYSAGDQMLRRLSDLLAQHLRPGDFLARWRVGDEFLVVLPETGAEKAFAVAERLRSAVERVSKSWEIPVTVSIGISTCPLNGQSQDDLLSAVEKAAKLSKDNGKNQVNAA